MARFHPEAGDWFQQAVSSHDGDDLLVELTVLQVRKITAIVAAGQRGHLAYIDATDVANDFLEAAANETLRNNKVLDIQMTRSTADLWRILDELPWPTPGGPQAQPDIH